MVEKGNLCAMCCSFYAKYYDVRQYECEIDETEDAL